VKEKRLEFVNGGWVATDEACPVYEDMINNIEIGHRFLIDTFGVETTIAWHCDAFGHSSAVNQMFQWMGYEALFFGRVSDNMKNKMKSSKRMDLVW